MGACSSSASQGSTRLTQPWLLRSLSANCGSKDMLDSGHEQMSLVTCDTCNESLCAAASKSDHSCSNAASQCTRARPVLPCSASMRAQVNSCRSLAADTNSGSVAAASSPLTCGCAGLSHRAERHSLNDAADGAACAYQAQASADSPDTLQETHSQHQMRRQDDACVHAGGSHGQMCQISPAQQGTHKGSQCLACWMSWRSACQRCVHVVCCCSTPQARSCLQNLGVVLCPSGLSVFRMRCKPGRCSSACS